MTAYAARFTPILLVLVASGCLFSKNEDPEENVLVVNSTTNNAANSNVAIGPATLKSLDCTPNETVFVTDDGVPSGYELDEDSAVGFSTNVAGVGTYVLGMGIVLDPKYVASGAWAKVVDGELRVAVGASTTVQTGDQATAEQFWVASLRVPATEVYSLLFDAESHVRRPGAAPFTVNVLTDTGVYTVSFAVVGDVGADLEPTWEEDSLQRELAATGVTAANRVDFAPILQRSDDSFLLGYSGLMFAGAGRTGDATVLGAVRLDIQQFGEMVSFNATGVSTVNAIDNRLEGDEIFGFRFAFGIEDSSGGLPKLMVLARDPNGADYRPRVLRIGNGGYEEQDVGNWPLPGGATLTRSAFTFLDGYEANAVWVQEDDGPTVHIDATTAVVSYGYAALADGGTRLFVGRPGGVTGFDVLETDFAGASEIAAIRNLPLDPDVGSEGFPVLVVVDGVDRDAVSLMQWDFGADIEVLPDAFGGRFADIRHIGSPVLTSGGDETLAFRARLGSQIGIGLFRFGAPSRLFRDTVCGDR